MNALLTQAATFIRDTVSGRRRLTKYGDPEAHRRPRHDRDAGLANHYIPSSNFPTVGGL
ncbi:hypothetical protein ACIRU3_25540 [Streptomyces sp. NPDC101151]|uniref:hypothetical protein n=1 Tax=Streptomyces sp. NPDC101151 TaxID=3366115 RepID=UPI0037F627D8